MDTQIAPSLLSKLRNSIFNKTTRDVSKWEARTNSITFETGAEGPTSILGIESGY